MDPLSILAELSRNRKMKKHYGTNLEIASTLAKKSNCQSMQVACLVTNENDRIISTGVNGTISGEVNCNLLTFEDRGEHSAWSTENEIHAEMNAILELAANGTSAKELNFYITHSPCPNCMKHVLALIARVGSGRIVFKDKYDRCPDAKLNEMLERATKLGIEVINFSKEEESNESFPEATR